MAETVDTIMTRLLSNISDSYDKSVGSFFYDVLKPVAIEAERIYSDASAIIDRSRVSTAEGEDLDVKVGEIGMTRVAATYATGSVTITGTAGTTITAGLTVISDDLNFTLTESGMIGSDGTLEVSVQCDTAGAAGNVPAGAIKNFLTTVSGMTSVTNAEALSGGYDEETDEELRERYYEAVARPATSGNKYHYIAWAKEVNGVGDARCIPLWNGAGTVKVVIIDEAGNAASDELVEEVAEYIEELRPVGAAVTVVAATPVAISVNLKITLADGYTIALAGEEIISAITAYLQSTAFSDGYVSYAKIGSAIINTYSVADYEDLTVNSGTANIELAEDEIPTMGEIAVSLSS